MAFKYYYGAEANQYTFLRIPKSMITDKAFVELSLSAKLLYGLLLDRMSLSMKNQWLDEENRVYIIYQIKDIMKDLNLTEKMAIKYLKELEKFGLVEKKRRGLGLPSILYVKSFVIDNSTETKEGSIEEYVEKTRENQGSSRTVDLGSSRNVEMGSSGADDNGSSRIVELEGSGATHKEVQEQTKGMALNNNTNKSNNNINNTKNNNTDSEIILSNPLAKENFSGVEGTKVVNFQGQADMKNLIDTVAAAKSVKNNGYLKDMSENKNSTSEFDDYMNYIKKSIDYDGLISRHYAEKSMIDGIVNLIVETIISGNDYIVISSNKFPKEVVKGRFSKLDMSHIEYVLECMKHNTSDIKNIKKYLLAALYNAPTTIDSYYQARVQHDMPQLAQRRDGYGYN